MPGPRNDASGPESDAQSVQATQYDVLRGVHPPGSAVAIAAAAAAAEVAAAARAAAARDEDEAGADNPGSGAR